MKLQRTVEIVNTERRRESGSGVLWITLEDPELEEECALLSFGPKDVTKNGFPYHLVRPGQELEISLERMNDPPAGAEVAPDTVRLMAVSRIEIVGERGTDEACIALFSSVPRPGELARDAFGCERHLAPWHELFVVIPRAQYEKLICLAQVPTFFKVSFTFLP